MSLTSVRGIAYISRISSYPGAHLWLIQLKLSYGIGSSSLREAAELGGQSLQRLKHIWFNYYQTRAAPGFLVFK